MPTTPDPVRINYYVALAKLKALIRDYEDDRVHPDHASGLAIAAADLRRILRELGEAEDYAVERSR
jgi:hypothetical protein